MNEMTRIEDEQRRDLNPFGANSGSGVVRSGNAMIEVESSRAVAETQAAILLAKKFPRDPIKAMDNILQAFTRPTLAEKAEYAYARGGTEITGPSIRAAETIAQLWGNLQFGIRELTQANGASEVEAFAWDVETNTRQVKVFKVPHSRYSRSGGNQALTDPRDIYEMVANQGARRLRACILGIIPGDVIEAAMNQADATLKTKAEVTPERIKSLLEKFAEYGVTRQMIETKIQRRLDAMTPALLVQLGKVYNALRDGIAKVSDHFDPETATDTPKATLKERLVGGAPDTAKPAATAVRGNAPQERARNPDNEGKSRASATEKGARPPAPPADATVEQLVSGHIVIHDDEPAQNVAGATQPAGAVPSPQPTPAEAPAAQGNGGGMPYDATLAHAKKAKSPEQVEIVRDVLRDAGYTEEQTATIDAILKSKTFA